MMERCPPYLVLELICIDTVTLANAQKQDISLARYRTAAVEKKDVFKSLVGYFWENNLLMWKRIPVSSECEADTVFQIVLPTQFRSQVLALPHDHSCSGHLGIMKTYPLIIYVGPV